jgi:hypothetical protein
VYESICISICLYVYVSVSVCVCLRMREVFHDSVPYSGVCECMRASVRLCACSCVYTASV